LTDLVVFISAFMGWTSSSKMREAPPKAAPSGGLMMMGAEKVKQKRGFANG
jgi:hypothetical protein